MEQQVRADLEDKLKLALAELEGTRPSRERLRADRATDLVDELQRREEIELTVQALGSHRQKGRRILQALARLESADFGSCEDCGNDIGKNRLQALPWATLCLECQQEREFGDENIARVDATEAA